MGICLILAV